VTFDAHVNLASGTVSAAPAPAGSGTVLSVVLDAGVTLPATPFNARFSPADTDATFANTEIIRCTNVTGTTWTVQRTQEGTTARAIAVGDVMKVSVTAKALQDVETAITTETARAIAAEAALAGAAAGAFTPTAVKTSAYTAATGDFVPVDATSGAVTVTLPTAPADKTRIYIKKIDATANIVTVSRGGSTDVFNKTGGSTSVTIDLSNQAISLQYLASLGIWYVYAGNIGVSQLDARYDAIGAATAEGVTRAAADVLLAPLASPALTGNPTVPTQPPGTNSTRAASTAYADAAVAFVPKRGAVVNWIGDSIAPVLANPGVGSAAGTVTLGVADFLAWAHWLSNGKILYGKPAGVTGQKASDMARGSSRTR
jgi:hypothetical protein